MDVLNIVLKLVRFSKKIIIVSISSVIGFAIAVLIITYPYPPDILISKFIEFFEAESGVLGVIKVVETIVEKIIKTDEKETEELSGSFPDIPILNLSNEVENNDKSI